MKKTAAQLEQEAQDKEQRIADTDADDVVIPEGDPDPDPERNQVGMKRYVNPTREAIMDKAAARRGSRKQADTDQLDDEGVLRQEAMEAGVRGEENLYDKESDDADDDAGDKPDEKKPVETVDSDAEMVTITVDGVAQEVTRGDVEKAGIAAIQKTSTADKRMKEATQYEASLKTLESTLRKQAEDLNARKSAGDGSVVDDGDANLPADAGAVAKAVEVQAEAVAEAIYSGDQDQVKESLAGLVASVAQGRTDSTPPLDAKQFAQEVRTQLGELDAEEQAETVAAERVEVAETVNSTFEKEFPDLYADDRGFRLTKAEFEGLCEEKPEVARIDLMREAAATVDELVNPDVGSELTRRRARKRGADAETPRSTQRAAPDKPKRSLTRKETVSRMAAARGQSL